MSNPPDSEHRVQGVSPTTSLVVLELTDSTRRRLLRNGIETVEALMELGAARLRLLRGIGPLRYREIQRAFRTTGLAWRNGNRSRRGPGAGERLRAFALWLAGVSIVVA
jgi:hypothetical protein